MGCIEKFALKIKNCLLNQEKKSARARERIAGALKQNGCLSSLDKIDVECSEHDSMYEGYDRYHRWKICMTLIVCLLIVIISPRKYFLKQAAVHALKSIEFLDSSSINLQWQSPTVLPIIVISKAQNIELRDTIRRTWAFERFYQNQTIEVKLFFLVGTDDFTIQRVRAEQMIFTDIIHVSLPEMYSFAAYKELSALIWMRTHLPKAKFYIKTEDHVMINTQAILEKLFPLIENLSPENVIIGWFGSEHIAQRGTYQKYVNAILPPVAVRYAMGFFYIVTSSAADRMLQALNQVELTEHPGDRFLTGILRQAAHVKMKNLAVLPATYPYSISNQVCSKEFEKNKKLLLCASSLYQKVRPPISEYFEAWNFLLD